MTLNQQNLPQTFTFIKKTAGEDQAKSEARCFFFFQINDDGSLQLPYK